MIKKALVLGANGLIGKSLTRLLLKEKGYQEVYILVRQSIKWNDNKLIEHIIDFNQLSSYTSLFQVDHVFCCLGTTIKKAKTKEAFYRVDHDYVVESAKLASQHQVTFLVVSSLGANTSSTFFYSRVKGQMEESLKQLNLPSLHIFRPSLLLGDREEFRLGEKIAAPLSKLLMHGPFRSYKAIHANTVAKAMINVANKGTIGQHIYSSIQIAQLATENNINS